MILGNAAWGFRETPLEKQLAITKDMGLILLELSIAGHPNDFLQLDSGDKDIEKVKEMFTDYGIGLEYASGGNDFTLPDEKECIEQVRNLKQVINIAGKLGIKAIRIFEGFSEDAITGKRWELMIKCMKEVADAAADKGILLAVETHGGVRVLDGGVRHLANTSTNPKSLKRLLDEVPENIVINYDPANLWAVGVEKPYEIFNQFFDKVKYVHLKDFKLISGVEDKIIKPVGCGEGGLDWDAEMKALKRYDGPAFIEYENTEDAEDGFRRSLAFLKKYEIQKEL